MSSIVNRNHPLKSNYTDSRKKYTEKNILRIFLKPQGTKCSSYCYYIYSE